MMLFALLYRACHADDGAGTPGDGELFGGLLFKRKDDDRPKPVPADDVDVVCATSLALLRRFQKRG